MTEIPPKSLASLVAAAGVATAAPEEDLILPFAMPEPRRRPTLPPISAGSWFKRRAAALTSTQCQPEGSNL